MSSDDGFSPDHYDHERAEQAAIVGDLAAWDDRPTRREAEADEAETRRRGRP